MKPAYAVGDIHGRLDLLDRMIEEIARDCRATDPKAAPGSVATLTLLGDYIDRGPHGRQVLERVKHLVEHGFCGLRIVALRGNHEDLMAKALLGDRGVSDQAYFDWWRNGATETLQSFGMKFEDRTDVIVRYKDIVSHMRARFGDLLGWAAKLPLVFHVNQGPTPPERLLYVHAGIDPYRKLRDQEPETLLWTREPSFLTTLDLPFTVIHGHTPLPEAKPELDGTRINLDTKAYRTGILSAVRAVDGTFSFIQVGGPRFEPEALEAETPRP
jgi:serine/threonine protein phosphatase 1